MTERGNNYEVSTADVIIFYNVYDSDFLPLKNVK